MSWERLNQWYENEGVHKLMGSDGRRDDLAARVAPAGQGKWEIRTWPRAAVGFDNADILELEGTLEEAKAVAYAQVKM